MADPDIKAAAVFGSRQVRLRALAAMPRALRPAVQPWCAPRQGNGSCKRRPSLCMPPREELVWAVGLVHRRHKPQYWSIARGECSCPAERVASQSLLVIVWQREGHLL